MVRRLLLTAAFTTTVLFAPQVGALGGVCAAHADTVDCVERAGSRGAAAAGAAGAACGGATQDLFRYHDHCQQEAAHAGTVVFYFYLQDCN
jgi:hypothetical protein